MFDLVQIIYWLSLSTWFGAVLFIAVAAPVIARAVRENNPVLTNVLSVNLEGQHASLLVGSIIGRIMNVVIPLELACAGAMLVAMVGQWILLHPVGPVLVQVLVRAALYLGAVGLLIYHWRVVWPKVWRYRQEYIDHADEPDVANPALDEFDRLQAESTYILFFIVSLLLGMILFSANIRPVLVVSAS